MDIYALPHYVISQSATDQVNRYHDSVEERARHVTYPMRNNHSLFPW